MGGTVPAKKLLSLLCLLLLALLTACSPSGEEARVDYVIDGDTIVLAGGQRLRYIGIDTPELRPKPEYYAEEALQANRALVERKAVRLEKDVSDKDKYGRLLRYVYVGDIFVNAELVRQGYAEAKRYPPDTKYQDFLEELEREAKRAGRGIWQRARTPRTGEETVLEFLLPR